MNMTQNIYNLLIATLGSYHNVRQEARFTIILLIADLQGGQTPKQYVRKSSVLLVPRKKFFKFCNSVSIIVDIYLVLRYEYPNFQFNKNTNVQIELVQILLRLKLPKTGDR